MHEDLRGKKTLKTNQSKNIFKIFFLLSDQLILTIDILEQTITCKEITIKVFLNREWKTKLKNVNVQFKNNEEIDFYMQMKQQTNELFKI